MHHRKTASKIDTNNGKEKETTIMDSDDSENEQWLSVSEFEGKIAQRTKRLPQSSDRTTKILDSALVKLSPRWRNWIVRLIFSFFMISGFIIIIYVGPIALVILTLVLQVGCFHEIISVGYVVYSVHRFPWFRSLSWYFLITANYFFYGESLVKYLGKLVSKVDLLQFLVIYHRFISFALYIIGFVWFVLSLVKKFYIKQFNLYAWTHIALLIVVTQSYLILQNLFEGLIWFIVPVSMITCNDIFAYVFGFFLGKTPLIELSPKKTWEGFIGGAICTVILGVIISHVFCQYKYFVCPVEYSVHEREFCFDCVPSAIFQLKEYSVPPYLVMISQMLGYPKTVQIYPFVLHSLALSLFSSIIGPFGGFFASGFKRAFKVKDFGDIIPGHGGLTDRIDCQLLMATFVHVYFHSFIRAPDINSVLKQIYMMEDSLQLEFFLELNKTLHAKGLL